MTEIYRKNNLVTTEAQAIALLASMTDFVENAEPGKTPPVLDDSLMNIWNGGLAWEWSEESEQEYDQRIASEQAEADLLALHQSNLEVWKNDKIRPWRDLKLFEWIDQTFLKPLLYDLDTGQETERLNKRQELLDWPGTFTEWIDDAAIEAAKPTAPSWIT